MKVALVCIARDEDNYIQEWIDYHLKLGFDDVYVYANHWNWDTSQSNVFVKPWDGARVQDKAYQNFIDTLEPFYDYAAFFDVDEFLVLKQHSNVKDFIQDHIQSEGGIALNWVFFGDCNHKDKLPSYINGEYSPIKRFIYRSDVTISIKTIVKLKNNSMNHVHCPMLPINDTNGNIWKGPIHPDINKASVEVAQINHYYTKSWEEWVAKVDRGRADNGQKRSYNEWHELDSIFSNPIEDKLALNFMYPNYG